MYPNVTEIEVTLDLAWTAGLTQIAPLVGSYSQKVYTDLEPGQCYVLKEFTIDDLGEYFRKISFTVK